MVLEMLLKVIHATSVEKLDTLLESVLYSKLKNKEYQKLRSDKEKRRDLGLSNRDRKVATDLVVKKALAAWGDSSSDSEDPDESNDVSMVVVHTEEIVFNEMFALMAHTENEEEDNQVTLLDMKNDLDKYSLKN